MVFFESGIVLGSCLADFLTIVETKLIATESMSSSAMIRFFLHFVIIYATLEDASEALDGVRKKLENTTGCLFILDNFRIKNSRGLLDKKLWSADKWRFSFLLSMHCAAKILQPIIHCG